MTLKCKDEVASCDLLAVPSISLFLHPCRASSTPRLERLWDLGACGQ
jgi:hypothetical protein